MAFAKNQMGLGVAAAEAAGDFIAQVQTGISAAGTTQATATLVSADANLVSTVAASSGVIVYNGQIGDSCIVFNDGGANTLIVYPPTSGKINNLATNAGMVLGINTAVLLMKVSATRWLGVLSA